VEPDDKGQSFFIPSLGALAELSEECDLSLCPVRALRIYAERTRSLRGARRRFFIPYSYRSFKGMVKRALAVNLRSAVIEAYKAADLPPPSRANPNDIRAVTASMAYHCNISVADILRDCFLNCNLVLVDHQLQDPSTEDLTWVSRLGPQVFVQHLAAAPQVSGRRGAPSLTHKDGCRCS